MTGQEADRLTGLVRPLRFVIPGAASRAGIQSRTDGYLNFIGGENVLGRRLNTAEIYAASPELSGSYAGRTIASLLEDASHLGTAPERIRNAQRRILAVAAGGSANSRHCVCAPSTCCVESFA
ncbi:hypothetical protein [Nocardioides caldifontis]|uniref:hypothetical protein n=1 Tax=Nocardioides caldifontis TaxID=2588938 RepID=UPI0011DF253F|nr:hypothetical protein [Nocardioides caldifontis]